MDLFEDHELKENINRIYTLSEIAEQMTAALREAFPESFWVKVEIAKMNIYPGTGHCYLDLIEKSEGKTKAQFRGVIWVNDFEYIARKFTNVVGSEIRGGITVLFLARLNFHPVYGFSLVISDIEPTFTLGELAKEKQTTIEKLKKEGLFEANKKLQVPLVPLRIAVISAETSKGFSDFITILRNWERKYAFQITLFPSLLQGDKAVESISNQLKAVGTQKESFDLVALIRGGGDEIGMTCFDSYMICGEIGRLPIPVITGIGHSTNETVAEMVASRNKITPTDVAYFILGLLDGFLEEIEFSGKRTFDLAKIRIRGERNNLDHLYKMLTVFKGQVIRNKLNILSGFETRLHDLNPKNILKRGYSITYREDGTIVKNAATVDPGEMIITELAMGNLKSKVETISENNIK
ncbi:MAG: exodeoxyribonuclease VII large subunit [Bacteroidetes bacterium]|nr:exodeoxyribonuclease VII large subunit [Bacteroidota bacterium]